MRSVIPTRDLLGRELRDLRVSVTDRCNFRCRYCMPKETFGPGFRFLPRSEILTFEEITRVVEAATWLGVTKVRLTGGEPLLRRDLPTLVDMLSQLPRVADLAMTTNGFLLARSARALAAAGLQRVTVSLDSIDPQVFRLMNGVDLAIEPVLEGIQAAAEAGLGPIKLNAVIRRGLNEDGILELAAFARKHGYVLRLIEYMDVGESHGWRMEEVLPSSEVLALIGAEWPLEAVESGHPGDVAQGYRYLDGGGEIGVISSVTEPFCGACSRLRLTADGKLHTCLFARLGHDLRPRLRQGADREALIAELRAIWGVRADRYSELRSSQTRQPAAVGKPEMSYLGG
ncbi:MAG TPA: GTP 3',8-cyclase MoaA [Candidatus Dormibacteraeota bacterium]|nr:GTP 3',8-cyclase MoaA [Candidatus Dormibacteraeota bacterium]